MSFMWLVLVVVSMLLPQVAPSTTSLPSSESAIGVFGLVFAWGLLGKISSIRTAVAAQSGKLEMGDAVARIIHWRERLLAIWCMALPIVMLNLQWGEAGRWVAELTRSNSLGMLVWLLPTIAVACLLTGSVVQLKRFVTEEVAGLDLRPEAASNASSLPGWAIDSTRLGPWAHLWHESRQYANGTWLLLLMPVFVVGAVADGISIVTPDWQDRWWSNFVWLGLLATVGTLFPNWIAMTWRTVALPPAVQERIGRLVRDTKSGRIDAELWPAGKAVQNALVVGWWRFNRKLIISDGLLDRLSPSELDLVCLHELAHVRRGHLWMRLFALAPALLFAFGCWQIDHFFFSSMGGNAYSVAHLLFQMGCAGATVATFLGAICMVAHWTELDADRCAVQLASTTSNGISVSPSAAAGALISALENLSGKRPGNRRSTWLHPSIDRRVQCLHQRFRGTASV